MADSKDEPQLDLAAIEFPTDRITLGQMRQREPHNFTDDALTDSAGMLEAIAAYTFELKVAENAFARALGRPAATEEDDRATAQEVLEHAYPKYGLSSGPEHTRQLIRDIEAAAAKQAAAFLGRAGR